MTAQHSDSILVALDVGERRVGIATASVIARLPTPHSTLQFSENVFEEIAQLTHTNHAKAIVAGLPRNLSGDDTAQTGFVRNFIQTLKDHTKVPIYFQDEALTSRQAEDELEKRGVTYNKGEVDALAATYILSDFLREHPEV